MARADDKSLKVKTSIELTEPSQVDPEMSHGAQSVFLNGGTCIEGAVDT